VANFTTGGIRYEVQNFAKGFAQLGRLDTAQMGIGKSAVKLAGDYKSFGASLANVAGGALSATVNGLTKMAQAVGAFGASVVKEGRAYTSEMSNVQALTGATGDTFDKLSAQAEELGRTTKFTATEAAEGMSFLAMAGFEVDDIVGSLPGVLDLASASNLDLGKSADIVSNVLSGFNADVGETGKFVDILSKTAASANTDVSQLGQAFKFVAPVAGALGIPLNQVSAALGTLGNAGVQAGNAGRGLRGILSKLTAPTGAAKDAMEALGIEVFNADGTLKSLPQIIGSVNQATAGMTDQQRQVALSTIFSREEISNMLILMSSGQGQLEDFGKELADSVGFAAEVAATQMNNLSGDITLFQSAV